MVRFPLALGHLFKVRPFEASRKCLIPASPTVAGERGALSRAARFVGRLNVSERGAGKQRRFYLGTRPDSPASGAAIRSQVARLRSRRSHCFASCPELDDPRLPMTASITPSQQKARDRESGSERRPSANNVDSHQPGKRRLNFDGVTDFFSAPFAPRPVSQFACAH